MKTLFTTLAFTSLLVLSAPAQTDEKKPAESTPPKKEEPASGKKDRRALLQDRFAKVSEELKLTDEQKEKLRPVFKEEGEKLMAVRTEAKNDRRAAFQKLREIHEETAKKVKPVLTPEQTEKWEKMKEENLPARKKGK
jgi:Spy/CpxP family protein refolding chaperone